MKWIFLQFVALAVTLTSFAQKINQYTYWFDNNISQGITTSITPVTSYTIAAGISTTGIAIGLHTLNVQVGDDTGHLSSAVSTWFYKMPAVMAKGYEYWCDNNYAAKVSGTVTSASTIKFVTAIDASTVTPGLHTFNIRFMGDSTWSSPLTQYFYKTSSLAVKAYEYWYDYNYAAKIGGTVSASSLITLATPADATGILAGLHQFNIRFKGDSLWSITQSQYFYKTSSLTINGYEYWYDGNYIAKIAGTITPGSLIKFDTALSAATTTSGWHFLNIRFRGDSLWSTTISQVIFKPTGKITGYEYWFDNNYAGKVSSTNTAEDTIKFSITINADALSEGFHIINVRSRTSDDVWTTTVSTYFLKLGGPAGVLITAYRYWFDSSLTTQVSLPVATPAKLVNISASINAIKLGLGTHLFHFQSKDTTGLWSSVLTDTVNVIQPLTIDSVAVSATSACPGSGFPITAKAYGDYAAGNVFTAQLSDTSGSFVHPVNIGSLKANPQGDDQSITINAVMPGGIPNSNKYLVRVIGSNPADTSGASQSSITVQKPNLGNDTTVSTCPGTPVNLEKVYDTAGLAAIWNTPKPDSILLPGKYTIIVTNNYGCKDTAVVTIADYAKPNLGNDTTVKVCLGSATNITGLYNLTGYTVQWSTPRPDSVGVGVYTLIVTNSHGCMDTAVITVTNYPKPNLGNDTTVKVCPGSFTNITGLYNLTGYTVQWSTATPDSVGAGVYTIIVTNTNGCKDTAVITVSNYIKPNLGNDTTVKVCPGSFTNITGLYNLTGYTVQWSTAHPDSVGAGIYTLTVTNTNGCMDTAIITVSSYIKPNIGNDTTIDVCLGKAANITNVYNLAGYTVQWNTSRPDSVGAGSYTVIATNANGCSDTAVVTVKVNGAAPVISSFAPVAVQHGDTVIIKGRYFSQATGVAFGGVPAASFTIISDSVIKAVVGTGATGSVSVTDACGTDSLTGFTLPLQWVSFTGVLKGNNTLLNWVAANEINTAYFGIERSADGAPFTNIGKVNARGNTSGNTSYSFVDVGAANLGAARLYYRLREIDKDGNASYSNTILVDIDGVNKGFVIAPNPAKDILHIHSAINSPHAVVRLLDMDGRVIKSFGQTVIQGGEVAIDISRLAQGVYILVIETPGEQKQFKVVKE